MNSKKITLTNKSTGQTRTAPVGFSWTTFLFGYFVPALRGDIKWALISFGLGMLTAGISNIIFAFYYNKIFIWDLMKKGFIVPDEDDCEALIAKNIITRDQAEDFIVEKLVFDNDVEIDEEIETTTDVEVI